MKKFYTLLAAAACCSVSAFAQWSTDRDVATTIFPEDKGFYSNEVCVGVDGTIACTGLHTRRRAQVR